MPGWTKKNFDGLEDRSPAGVPMRWRFSRSAIHSSQVGVSLFTYEASARMPFGHVLRVAPPVIRAFEAGPDGLEVICVGGRRPEGGDSERFVDFWPPDSPGDGSGEPLA